jgi:VanZ family protein
MSELPPSLQPHPVTRSSRFWFLAWIGWFLGIFVLSSIPGDQLPKLNFLWADKFEHLIAYLVGTFCFGMWLMPRKPTWPAWWLLIVFAATSGGLDEFHQAFTPNRSGLDLLDWVADLVGGSLACFIVPGVFQKKK